MKTFTDTAGRTWSIRLTLGSALAVKESTGADLLNPEAGDPPLLTRLGTDEMLLGEVLCALLADQFETHSVTAEDVRNSFDGPTLLAAHKAFYAELEDFFRSRGRTDRAAMVAKQAAIIDRGVAAIEAKIDAVDPEALIDGVMSGDSPEALVSTRED